ncbi:MAG: LCP family protein [Chloroflexi bacterium]|nr:LCP family protein [Chloroflexota bacterium]
MLESLKKSPLKIGLILAALIIINVIGWYAYFNWDTPFGEPLNLPTATVEQLPTPTSTEPPETPVADSPTETPEPEITPTIAPVCGDDLSMTILLTGIDSEGYLFGLADSIRLVRIDFQAKRVDVVAIPRDLWVNIPGAAVWGVSQGKLNQAYFYGTEGMGFYSGTGYGSGLLAHTLLENYGVHVDHYLSVNLHAFRTIVDALGGLDVYLPVDVYIKHNEQPKFYLGAGTHHLTGKQAEMVVRTRIDIGDFGRIRNQTLVLKALAVKMLTPNGIKQIPDLTSRLLYSVLTDLSASNVSQMACLAALIDPKEDIHFDNVIPVEDEAEIGQWIMDEYQGYQVYALFYDKAELTQRLAEFRAGTWPER